MLDYAKAKLAMREATNTPLQSAYPRDRGAERARVHPGPPAERGGGPREAAQQRHREATIHPHHSEQEGRAETRDVVQGLSGDVLRLRLRVLRLAQHVPTRLLLRVPLVQHQSQDVAWRRRARPLRHA